MIISENLLRKLKCNKCGNSDFENTGKELVCKHCNYKREVLDKTIIRDKELEENIEITAESSNGLTYEANTKHRYQSSEYAQNYFKQYKNWYNPKNIYNTWITSRERDVVESLIAKVAPEVNLVLDLPAGSGKLADVHRKFNYYVIPADISVEMLKAGLKEWYGRDNVLGMIQMDATDTNLVEDGVDAVVCLRLMHRLNLEMNKKVLAEFKRAAKKYIIVSYSVSDYSIADTLSRKSKKYNQAERMNYSAEQWLHLLGNFGTVIDNTFIQRGVSREVVSLVEVG